MLAGLALALGGCSLGGKGAGTAPPPASAEVAAQDKQAEELGNIFEEAQKEAPPSQAPLEAPPPPVLSEMGGKTAPPPLIEPPAPPVAAPVTPMFIPVQVVEWEVISGAPAGNLLAGRGMTRFMRPVAVAARDDYVYVVDADMDAVLRYDRATHRLETLLDLKAVSAGEVADIFVDKDLSFYLADTRGAQVLHYDRGGRLLRTYRNHFNLARPVAVLVDGVDRIVVADGYYDHLLRFNGLGQLVATLGGRGDASGEFLNIMALAKGPDGYYVAGRVGRKIQVLAPDGGYLYSFEEGQVLFPSAIVVDAANRAYVGDYQDNRIKVFDRGRLVTSFGGTGGAPGQFHRIADLWLDNGFLYVADSLNGRIQVGRLAASGGMPMPAQ